MIDCTLGPQLLSDELIELGSSHCRLNGHTLAHSPVACVHPGRLKKKKNSSSYLKFLAMCLWFILTIVCVVIKKPYFSRDIVSAQIVFSPEPFHSEEDITIGKNNDEAFGLYV